jgi:hypothetical protein
VVFALVNSSIVRIGGEYRDSVSVLAIVGVSVLASVAAMLSRKPWLHVVVATLMIGINALTISTISFSPPAE